MKQNSFDLFIDFVEEIKKIENVKIAIVSSGSKLYIEDKVTASGLAATHVLTFEDHHSKEEKIETICKEWGVGLDEVLYFTDTKADVYELENCLDRRNIIGCAWGFHGFEKLREVLPENQILKNFSDIHTIFIPGKARRETDTMPNWAGSSWYWLRYMDPKNDSAFAAPEKMKYWAPVDWYNGGNEHTVLHLLYSRFWNQFLFDQGLVPTLEPYKKRTSHGIILAEDGEKMSKSRGNVVNPDEIVAQFGADALRTYIMFMGPFDQAVSWSTNGVLGVYRFLEKVWNVQFKLADTEEGISEEQYKLGHRLVAKVSSDIDEMKFNTAVAKMMETMNELAGFETISKEVYSLIVRALAPFAPHLAEELWSEVLGGEGSVAHAPWPIADTKWLSDDTFNLVIQVNGKVRDELVVSKSLPEDEIKKLALGSEKIIAKLEGKEPKKVIYVKEKLVSIVI
jgi:leucyl-tRNA synthetase